MAAKIIDGKAIGKELRATIPRQVERLKAQGVQPHLVSIQVGDDAASSIYVANQRKRCVAAGIIYTLHPYDGQTTEEELAAHVMGLNEDDSITGVILQLPLPPGIRAGRIQSLIRPEKDVEGMNPSNLGVLVQERPIIIPCTALAVFELIQSTGAELRGKEAAVVGHSPLVGKPVSILLLNALATVTTCHVATGDLGRETRRADILVTAAGVPGLITGSMIRPGAVVIDVGITLQESFDGDKGDGGAGGKRRQTVGDVVFEEAVSVAGHLTPVPGGVGPVTVAMLLSNTIRAAALSAGLEPPPLYPISQKS